MIINIMRLGVFLEMNNARAFTAFHVRFLVKTAWAFIGLAQALVQIVSNQGFLGRGFSDLVEFSWGFWVRSKPKVLD